jgi:SAM-dependent methyltransferase
VLARLGKRVLRPGGKDLTERMLGEVDLRDRDVVELAPGLGWTARRIVAQTPRSYVGVDASPEAGALVQRVVGDVGRCVTGDASATGLPDASADAVVGEAMLSMQTDNAKSAIVAEAVRVLRAGGVYAIHELGLAPDGLPDETKTAIRRDLARAIKVNARPLTMSEWRGLLEEQGLVVEFAGTAPMALMEPARMVSDEGLGGALRIAVNAVRDPAARRRVMVMRNTFRQHRDALTAVALVARLPHPGEDASGTHVSDPSASKESTE